MSLIHYEPEIRVECGCVMTKQLESSAESGLQPHFPSITVYLILYDIFFVCFCSETMLMNIYTELHLFDHLNI